MLGFSKSVTDTSANLSGSRPTQIAPLSILSHIREGIRRYCDSHIRQVGEYGDANLSVTGGDSLLAQWYWGAHTDLIDSLRELPQLETVFCRSSDTSQFGHLTGQDPNGGIAETALSPMEHKCTSLEDLRCLMCRPVPNQLLSKGDFLAWFHSWKGCFSLSTTSSAY